MAAYRMTPARKAALRKAQAASARKRRGKGKGKLAKANKNATRNRHLAVVAATGGLALAGVGIAGAYYARKTASGGPKAPKLNHGFKKGALKKARGISQAKSLADQRRRNSVDPGFYGKTRKPYTGDPKFSVGSKKQYSGDPGFYGRTRRKSSVLTKGTKRTRLRNAKRSNRSLGTLLNSGMSTKSVMRRLNDPNYIWEL